MSKPGDRPTWASVIGWPALVVGLLLTGVNLVGLAIPLRADAVHGDRADLSGARILDPADAFAQLARLDPADRERFALEATRIVGGAVWAADGGRAWPADDPRLVEYHYAMPVWDNWIFFVLRYLHPSAYRYYHVCDWRRALERGIGGCEQQDMALVGFLREHGYRTGIVDLYRHTVALAETAPGRWIVLDPDFGVGIPHTLDELTADRALLEGYYAHQPGFPLWEIYTKERPQVNYGGPEIRYPRACLIERWAYVAKWGVPFVLLLMGAGLLVMPRVDRSR